MHNSSMVRMELFVRTYVVGGEGKKVLDVGSYSFSYDNYRKLFKDINIDYQGLDLVEGPNVDIVVKNPYLWDEIDDESFDYIISGQAFEHIEFPWLTMQQIYKKLKRDGVVCIIAPNTLGEHKYPKDCYRFFEDGLEALAKYAGLNTIEVVLGGVPKNDISSIWDDFANDVCLIAQKGEKTYTARAFNRSRKFDNLVDTLLKYEFMASWKFDEKYDEILKDYFENNKDKHIFLSGDRLINANLIKLFNEIGIDSYEEIPTNIISDYNRVTANLIDIYKIERLLTIKQNSLCIITEFDKSRDYIYLKDKDVDVNYLYDIVDIGMIRKRCDNTNIYIYGAGEMGLRLNKRLLDLGIDIKGYIVSDGYKVKSKSADNTEIYELSEIRKDASILVAVIDSHDIFNSLEERGYECYFNALDLLRCQY